MLLSFLSFFLKKNKKKTLMFVCINAVQIRCGVLQGSTLGPLLFLFMSFGAFYLTLSNKLL